ncbi:DNA-directed DNA polymerase [Aureococcus anophagefferens]|nr:DNA-directed DNA polymerase [Aureococcus anophagefferens]
MAERPPNDASRIASVATSLFAHAAAKGGQEGLDREKVNNIIFELSGSSSYTKEKLEHRGDAEKWVAAARRKLETFDGTKRSVAAHHLKKREAALEATRRAMDAAGTVCCVVDFDMFYAAVELRDRPELKDKPVAVGGPGMITTANYVARKWGVRSAMPGFIGQELCRRGPEFGMPRAELVFVRPDFEKYTAVSKVARAIFAEYDPHLACYSLDEAYLDLTLYLRARAAAGSHGEATKLLATPRPRKRKRAPASASPTTTTTRRRTTTTRRTASATTGGGAGVGGVGRVLEQKLEDGLGVRTCGELLDRLPEVHALFAPKGRDFLQDVALGVGAAGGPEDDDEDGLPKGLGNERTFRPVSGLGPLLAKLEAIAAIVAARLETRGMRAARATLKLKTSAFHVAARPRPRAGRRGALPGAAASIVAFSALILAILRRDVDMPLLGVGGADAEIMGSGAAPAYPRAPAPRGKQSSTSAA